jgi:ribosomal protein S18 acetylase RimI-like enzyme
MVIHPQENLRCQGVIGHPGPLGQRGITKEELLDFAKRAFNKDIDESFITESGPMAKATIINDKLISYMNYEPVDKNGYYINYIMTDPNERRQGHASKLIHDLQSENKQIILKVERDKNYEYNMNFYKKLGFTPWKEEENSTEIRWNPNCKYF